MRYAACNPLCFPPMRKKRPFEWWFHIRIHDACWRPIEERVKKQIECRIESNLEQPKRGKRGKGEARSVDGAIGRKGLQWCFEKPLKWYNRNEAVNRTDA